MKNTRRNLPAAVLVMALALAVLLWAGPAGADVPTMTKDELKAMLDNPDVIILDVRQGRDWKSSEFKIQGAVYAKPEDYTNWAGLYPKDKKLVLYCA